MANDCLVTKLKGVVQDDSLLKLGEMVIDINSLSSGYNAYASYIILSFVPNAEVTVTATDGAYFGVNFDTIESEHLTSWTFNNDNSKQLYFANHSGKLHIPNKYALDRLEIQSSNSLFSVNLDDLKYSESLSEFDCQSMYTKGSLDSIINKPIDKCGIGGQIYGSSLDFTKKDLSGLYLSSANIHADISPLSQQTALTRIQLNDCPNIYGDISALACPTTGTCNINDSGIRGSIEDFVSTMVQRGKTSSMTEDFTCYGFIKQLTFGREIREPGGTATGFLQWDTASKIYVFTGSYDFVTTTKVYAKGASASEISDWETAGKQVIEI